jgi:hypothetical protein
MVFWRRSKKKAVEPRVLGTLKFDENGDAYIDEEPLSAHADTAEPPERAAAASVYRTADRYVVAPEVGGGGHWVVGGSAAALPRPSSPQELGRLVLDALRQSLAQSPPEGERNLMRPVLRAAKLRSYRRLLEQSALCSVLEDGTDLVLTPTRNGGSTGPDRGFVPLAEEATKCPRQNQDIALVGHAVLETLERCL